MKNLLWLLIILTLVFINSSCEEIQDANNASQAYKLMEEGKMAEALEFYTKKIESDPDNPMNYAGRGNVYQNLGEHLKAVDDFNKAIDLDTDLFFINEARALSHVELENFEKAEKDLQLVVENEGDSPFIRMIFANISYKKGDYQGTIEICTEALREYPEDSDLLNLRGYTRNTIEDYEGAVNDFAKAISVEPESRLAFNNRGYAFYKLGQLNKAEQDIRKSLELFDGNALAHRNMGLVYLKRGDTSQACSRFRRAVELGYQKSYGRDVKELMVEHCR